MADQMVLPSKAFSACLTRKYSFNSQTMFITFMSKQVARLCEACDAQIAFVRLFTRMNPFMNRDISLCETHEFTKTALESFLFGVSSFMSL